MHLSEALVHEASLAALMKPAGFEGRPPSCWYNGSVAVGRP
jgi:hypothetical protein